MLAPLRVHIYPGFAAFVTAFNTCVAGVHIFIGPVSAIDAVGNGLTFTVTEDVIGFPHTSVTVTVYVVVTVGFTVNGFVVPTTLVPLLHEKVNGPPPVGLAFKVTGAPAQLGGAGVAVAFAPTG